MMMNDESNSPSFFRQPSTSMSTSLNGFDDINDVADMGGVNVVEESEQIHGKNIGTQICSCKDQVFPALQDRIRKRVTESGLEDSSPDVTLLISHALQERLMNIVEKLVVIVEHRTDIIKMNPRYEIYQDVRAQIKFLQDVDKAKQDQLEEMEREMVLLAAQTSSRHKNPQHEEIKAKAKEIQRAAKQELRQREANMTALNAIGPRKNPKLGCDTTAGASVDGSDEFEMTGSAPAPLYPRNKRITMRDMIFFMEQDFYLRRSEILYKAYLK